MAVERYHSPLGDLTIAADDEGLCGVWFAKQKHFGKAGSTVLVEGNAPHALSVAESPVCIHLDAARIWLDRYFMGEDPGVLPSLHLMGTPFQRAVWEALATIPYGETMTYGAIATELEPRLSRRISARAVGGAVGRNPVSVIVPCHRVLGAGDAITGYAGGLDRKRGLLQLEGIEI